MRPLRLREERSLHQLVSGDAETQGSDVKSDVPLGGSAYGNARQDDLGSARSSSTQRTSWSRHSEFSPNPTLQAVWPWASYLASLCPSFLLSKTEIIIKSRLVPICKQWHTKDWVREEACPRCCQGGGPSSFENSKRIITPISLVAFLLSLCIDNSKHQW